MCHRVKIAELKIGKHGSPGLVVMGVDSNSEGLGFESWRRILDGHDIVSQLVVCLKQNENKRKRGRSWPIFNNR